MKFFIVATTLLFVVSCTSPSKPPQKTAPQPAQPTQQARLQQAKIDLKKSNSAKALKAVKQIADENASTALAGEAHLAVADSYYTQKQYAKAYDEYLLVIHSQVQSGKEGEAQYKAALCSQALAQPAKTMQHINEALKYEPDIQTKVSLLKLRAPLFVQAGDINSAVEDYGFLLESNVDTATTEQAKNKVADLAESKMNEEQLGRLAGQNRFAFLRPQAYFRIATSAYDRGDFSRAKGYYSELVTAAPETSLADRAREALLQIEARSIVDSKMVGVVLPLSGKNSKVGYKALRGLQLGLGIYGTNPSGLKLAVMDSEENPEVARRAVEKLVLEDHAIAIVGSLLSKEANAVAAKAQELGVPNIALSQKSGVTKIGEYVFRNSVTSEMQIRYLLDIAMGQKGLKKFAILYPNDAYGNEYTNIFWEEVVARGGEIRAAQSYDPNETDFRHDIQKLVDTYYVNDRANEYRLALKEWQAKQTSASARKQVPKDLLPPVVDFDALFIPDSAKAVGQIAPMLAYNDIKDVTLLGTSLWNTPSLVQRGGKFVENSIFVDAFTPSESQISNIAFAQEFAQTYGYAPDVFEIQSYDAGVALRKVLATGASTRVLVKERLAQTKSLYGALGELGISSEREFLRPLSALQVTNGAIAPITK